MDRFTGNTWRSVALGACLATGIFMLLGAAFNPGDLPSSYTSGASYASSGVIRASQARLVGVHGFNSKASAVFIQLYNSATVPANGALPVVNISVPSNSSFSYDPGARGIFFGSGISWSQSTTSPAKTLDGTADVFLSARYD